MIDIDPVTMSLSFLLFGAVCTPFIYHSIKDTKKRKVLMLKLSELASLKNGMPTHSEIWRNQYAIGLDSEKKVLVYLRSSDQPLTSTIDLQQVKSAKIQKITREVKSDSSKRTIVDYVGIELSYLQERSNPTVLEFFDAELFTDLNGESVLAEKWVDLISNSLNKNSN
jgi:predicted transcriptional regulator